MDLPAIERNAVITGLLKEEVDRFAKIAKMSDDRTRWENKHAHIEDAGEIRLLAAEIVALAARRQVLETENEQEKHP